MYFRFRFLVSKPLFYSFSGFSSKECNYVIEAPIYCHKGPNFCKPDCLLLNQKRDVFQKEAKTSGMVVTA